MPQVAIQPESKAVEAMFARIANRYDIGNRVLSFGVDRYWRWVLVRSVCKVSPRCVVDLATGSGDVAFALRKKLKPNVSITGLDFCEAMLEQARAKKKYENIEFAFGDCMALPLENSSVDVMTIAFGYRNIENRKKALAEMKRVLKPNGQLCILEFTQPARWMRPFYGLYLKYCLSPLASLITKEKDAYEYLVGTIQSFPDKATISAELQSAGFQKVHARGLTGSIAALHTATPKLET